MTSSTPRTDSSGSLPRASGWLGTLVAAAVLGIMLCIAAFCLGGRTSLEKTLTSLIYPLGATWLLTAGWILRSLWQRQWRVAWLPSIIWCVLSVCSSALFVDPVTRYLEGQMTSFRPGQDPPLDVIVVLGGGTSSGPGRAQAGESGDRVLYAAQLYLQGHTGHLITTGEAQTVRGVQRPGPAQETVEIWTQLGIPPSDISTSPGLNTYQEMRALKPALDAHWSGRRVGLLTSATHLPRALRLAADQGLTDLIPLAADHRWVDRPKSIQECLPSAAALAQFTRCQKEFLARLVNR